MKITDQTTLAELDMERARLGIEWISAVRTPMPDWCHTITLTAILPNRITVAGSGNTYAEAFANLFAKVEEEQRKQLVFESYLEHFS